MITKADIVNQAYSQLRVSGLVTSPPSADERLLALQRLEAMAAEFRAQTGYRFEDVPAEGSDANIPHDYFFAFHTNLAMRLLADFNITAPLSLSAQAASSLSVMCAKAVGKTVLPSPNARHFPRGSGNRQGRGNRWRHFPTRPVLRGKVSHLGSGMLMTSPKTSVTTWWAQSGSAWYRWTLTGPFVCCARPMMAPQ